MLKEDLDERLLLACDKATCDLDEIRNLIVAGADTNQLNKYGESIFEYVFVDALYDICDNKNELFKRVEKIKEIIQIMIENDWNIKKFGLRIIHQFLFSTYDRLTFDLYKFMLQYDLTDDPVAYEEVLEGIGTEESYQRCCEENHDLENMFFAIYEMVDAKMKGKNFKSIELYYDATGMTIDKVLYFNETDTTVCKKDFVEFNADIGFVCKNKLLVLCKSVNVLFMNDKVKEQPQIDISDMFEKDVIGRKIASVSFEHKTVVKSTTHYGQPTIIITFDNDKKLKFTHNFGELPDKQTQSRFWIE